MIRRLLESYRLRKRDPVEFCRQCLARQAETSSLNAFVTITNELALRQAAEASSRFEAKSPPRLLEGVPVAIKDNFSTKDVKTTCASKMLHNYVPPYSATAVRRLQQAGAVMIGKTNLDEFAMGAGSTDSFFGPVKSPWSSDESLRSPSGGDWLITGGSSGGSGAAVASGTVLGALASDTGGSARSPGAMMGIVGYKPSYGLFSRNGLIPLVNSLDCVSILAPTPADCAIIAKALADQPENEAVDDSTLMNYKGIQFIDNAKVDISKLRIGVPKEYVTSLTSSDVLDAWQEAADKFGSKGGGAQLVSVSLPHTEYAISAYSVLCPAEVASNMARYDGLRYGFRPTEEEKSRKLSADELMAIGRAKAFGPVVRSRILAGNYFLLRDNYDAYVKKAMVVRKLINDDFDKAFKKVDLLLTPAVPGIPETSTYRWFCDQDNRTRVEENDVFSTPANLAGVPAVVTPIAMKNGWPRAVQLMGPRGHDHLLLQISEWLYQQYFPELGSNLLPKYFPL